MENGLLAFFGGDWENTGNKEEKLFMSLKLSSLNIICKHELQEELALTPFLLPGHSIALFPSLLKQNILWIQISYGDSCPFYLNFNSTGTFQGNSELWREFINTGQDRKEGKRLKRQDAEIFLEGCKFHAHVSKMFL